MRRPLAVTVALLVAGALAACGDPGPGGDQEGADEGPAEPPPCEVIYGTGPQVDSVVEVEETTGCLIDDEPTFFGLQREACTDGRTLFWNERGYGFSGAGWIDPEPGEHPPAREKARCRGAGP